MSKYLLFILLLVPSSFPLQARDIFYSGGESSEYVITLLKHILKESHSGTEYQVKSSGISLPKAREFDVMNLNEGIDIIAGGSTPQRELEARAIHFPLLKGVYGWRVALIHSENSQLFSTINNLEEFKKLVPGQFHLWSDSLLLEANNITVAKGADYEGLYIMLDKKRFDYFPRSIIEINQNFIEHKHLNIEIDKYALIHYPTAYYYYVRKDDDVLAQDLIDGLEQALQDGSLDELFNKYYGETIAKFRKENRKVFSLENPLLSPQTPLHRKELWLNFQ